jgi:hypothetical protein
MVTKTRSSKTATWAALYDLESQIEPTVRRAKATRGRPRNPVPRVAVTSKLTTEEKRIISRNAARIGNILETSAVTKGQVIGLALRLLDKNLQRDGGPARPGWGGLVDWLEAEEE